MIYLKLLLSIKTLLKFFNLIKIISLNIKYKDIFTIGESPSRKRKLKVIKIPESF